MQFDFRPGRKPLTFRSRVSSHGSSKSPFNLDLTRFSPTILLVAVCLVLFLGIGWFVRGVMGVSSQRIQTEPRGIVMFISDPKIAVRKHVKVLWIDPRVKQIKVLDYPDELMLQSPSFGTYPISSLYDFFTLDEKREPELLSSLSLGLHIYLSDSVVVSSFPSLPAGKNTLAREILLSKQTTLNASDRTALTLFLLSSPFPFQEQVMGKLLNPDETGAVKIEDSYLSWLRKEVPYIRRTSDQLTVAFVNASSKKGSAATLSNILEDFGLHPIGLTDRSEKLEQGRIHFATEAIANGVIAKMLEDITLLDGEVNTEETNRYRADVVVIVGEGLASRITQ